MLFYLQLSMLRREHLANARHCYANLKMGTAGEAFKLPSRLITKPRDRGKSCSLLPAFDLYYGGLYAFLFAVFDATKGALAIASNAI